MTQRPEAVLPVSLGHGTEEAGLAGIIFGLIRSNLAAHPERRRDLDRLSGCVVIEARDAETAATLVFAAGSVVVHHGARCTPDVHVSADSSTVIELSSLPIVGGIPWLFGRPGRRLVGGLIRGSVKIRGLGHTAVLVRLTRILSVYQ